MRPAEATAEPYPRRRLSCKAGTPPPVAMAASGGERSPACPVASATRAAVGAFSPRSPARGYPSHRSSVRLRMVATVAASAVVMAAAAITGVGGQPSQLDGVFSTAAKRVVRIAVAAREALEPPNPCSVAAALSGCGCSYSPCASSFADSLQCGPEFGPNGRFCGGGGCSQSKNDWDNSFVLPGRGQIFPDGATSAAVAKDVCLTKGMDRSVFRSLKSAKQITYFATSNGAFRYHPGRPSKVVETFDQCGGTFEARLRPWYSAASSGPKDVVIVVDASEEMTLPLADGGASRWTLAASAVADVLDTLNPRDFVAVVRSDGGRDGAVTVGGTGRQMVAVTEERVQELKEAIKELRPAGALNVAATMRAAFGLLQRSAEASGGRAGATSAGCSRVVIWITGGKDVCYSRPACQEGAAAGACSCTQGVLSQLENLQASLSAVGPGGLPRAMVTTLTVGDLVDDSLARQMACASSGTWARVTSQDVSGQDSVSSTDLTGYYRMLSAAKWEPGISEEQVVFSRLYEGAGNMGNMTTATIPLFSRFSKRVIGVAGVDIPIAELLAAAPGATRQDLVEEVATRAPQCERGDLSANFNPCDVQQLRGPEAACVPSRPPSAQRCFRHANDLYFAPPEPETWRSWEDANEFCGTLGTGGMLAPITSAPLNQLLSQLTDVDGTWVGVRRGSGASAAGEWVSPIGNPVRYLPWTVEPREHQCVALDRRGLESNWSARRCKKLMPFICVLPGAATASPIPPACGAGGVVSLDEPPGDRPNPLTATAECNINVGPPSCARAPQTVNTKPFCPLGLQSGNDACDNSCCDGCQCLAAEGAPSRSVSPIAVIAIVVGILVLVVLAGIGIIVWRRRTQARRGVIDDASDDDEYYVMRHSDEKSEKNYVHEAEDGVELGGQGGRAGERGRRPPTDAEAAYEGRQLEQATQPGEGVGNRVWSWSPGAFFAPRRPTQ